MNSPQSGFGKLETNQCAPEAKVAVLSAGKDPHYALGLLSALTDCGIEVDFIANNEMAQAPAARHPLVHCLNLRGCQAADAPVLQKIWRVVRYYLRLLSYAATARPKVFHILWFNKFEWFDNTALVAYYRALGKRLVFTAHNVNTRERDVRAGPLNRFALRFLYRTVDHIIVHTDLMKREVEESYGVDAKKISVIAFPVNNVTPRSSLSKSEARRQLGLSSQEKTVLFFGNLAPYKGLEIALEALHEVRESWPEPVRLLIVGRLKSDPAYWRKIESLCQRLRLSGRITIRREYVPEEEVGTYFRAADVLILPYRRVYQSGVMFLAYNQGLPVIAADVGALRESIVEGETGFVFQAGNAKDLAEKIQGYFQSQLFQELEQRRPAIVDYVNKRHSWEATAIRMTEVYQALQDS